MTHHPWNDVWIENRITINTEQKFTLSNRRCRIQAHRLALIFCLMNHPQFRKLRQQFIEQFSGTIFAAIIDANNLEIGVMHFVEIRDNLFYIVLFVVARHDDRNLGHIR